MSLINNVLRPLMNSSVDLTIGSPEEFNDDLNRIREEVLYNINATIAGSLDINITAELMRFFTDGLSTLYYNATFEATGSFVTGISNEERMCAINEIFMHYFPFSTEQAEVASLGRKLQQIKVAYDVARNVSVFTDVKKTFHNLNCFLITSVMVLFEYINGHIIHSYHNLVIQNKLFGA